MHLQIIIRDIDDGSVKRAGGNAPPLGHFITDPAAYHILLTVFPGNGSVVRDATSAAIGLPAVVRLPTDRVQGNGTAQRVETARVRGYLTYTARNRALAPGSLIPNDDGCSACHIQGAIVRW